MTARAKRIKKEITEIYSSDGEKPVNVAKEYTALYHAACQVFGSWCNALAECGIDYYNARYNDKWSNEAILNAIKELHTEGKTLQPSRLRNNGNLKLMSAANYHFGSWRKAVLASGIDYPYGRNSKPE